MELYWIFAQVHARPYCGVNGAGVFVPLDWEGSQGCYHCLKALSASIFSKLSCANSSQVETVFLETFYLSQGISQKARGLVSSAQFPRTGMHRLWLDFLIHQGEGLPRWNLLLYRSFPRFQILTQYLFPILPSHMESFCSIGCIGVLPIYNFLWELFHI